MEIPASAGMTGGSGFTAEFARAAQESAGSREASDGMMGQPRPREHGAFAGIGEASVWMTSAAGRPEASAGITNTGGWQGRPPASNTQQLAQPRVPWHEKNRPRVPRV